MLRLFSEIARCKSTYLRETMPFAMHSFSFFTFPCRISEEEVSWDKDSED